MKIVCATDFSPRARAAARVACELARRTAGSVDLIHVVVPRTADLQALAGDVGVLEDEIRKRAVAQLEGQIQELGGGGRTRVTFHVGEGDVEATLLAHAESAGADLIVMGAHSRPTLERLLLGSIAERTVRLATRPVLIVPLGVEDLIAAGQEDRALRVVTAVDGRLASEGALGFVRQLRSRVACDVTFLRLYWPVEEYRRLGLTGARDLAAADPEVVADIERTLRMQVGILPGTGKTSYAIESTWGDPASRILVGAGEHRADLIVMGAESRRGLARLAHPAVTNRMARHAFGVPIVFVPAPVNNNSRSEVPGVFTVLAPTDLSPAGNRAVPFAYAMVAAHGGVVELCHVHERALADPPYAYDRAEGKLTAEQRARIDGALRALIPTDAEALGISTRVTVIDGGKAASAITQAAERLVVDAIVLGSHGKGRALRAILGSVSHAVVRHAHRPVLVVPTDAHTSNSAN